MPDSASPLLVRRASELVPRPVEWLVGKRLARGKLAILDGDPGMGKSLIALDLCARLSRGLPFPDGSPCSAPGASLVLNGEDNEEDTTLPRLMGMGADIDRVFFGQRNLHAIATLSFPSQIDKLDEALKATGAQLLVIDPIMAFLDPGINSSSDQSVRRALYPLCLLAEKYRCAMLLNRHLNKFQSWRAMYRGGGSIGIIGMCRSAWLVGRDPVNPGRCVPAGVKNNLAGPQPSLAYSVSGTDTDAPSVAWHGPCSWTADQLLLSSASKRAEARDEAGDFLREFLAKGPRTSHEVWTAAQERKLAERTLNRAKKELKIQSVRVAGDGKGAPLTYWLLEGQKLPVDESTDLEPWLAPLRERFPSPTPLDEM